MRHPNRRQLLVAGVAAYWVGLVGYLAGVWARRPEEKVRRGGGAETIDRWALVDEVDVESAGPFDHWTDHQCAVEAARLVGYHVRDELELQGRHGMIEMHAGEPLESGREPGVLVDYVLWTDDWQVVDRPPVEYERLVEVAPQSATVEVEIGGDAHERTLPVWVQQIPEATTWSL